MNTAVVVQRKSKIFNWIFCNVCTIKMNECLTEYLLLSCKHKICRNCINKKNPGKLIFSFSITYMYNITLRIFQSFDHFIEY